MPPAIRAAGNPVGAFAVFDGPFCPAAQARTMPRSSAFRLSAPLLCWRIKTPCPRLALKPRHPQPGHPRRNISKILISVLFHRLPSHARGHLPRIIPAGMCTGSRTILRRRLALSASLWQKPAHRRRPETAPPNGSCGSSVVEHSLGKGEVESSILSRSTIKNNSFSLRICSNDSYLDRSRTDKRLFSANVCPNPHTDQIDSHRHDIRKPNAARRAARAHRPHFATVRSPLSALAARSATPNQHWRPVSVGLRPVRRYPFGHLARQSAQKENA